MFKRLLRFRVDDDFPTDFNLPLNVAILNKLKTICTKTGDLGGISPAFLPDGERKCFINCCTYDVSTSRKPKCLPFVNF